MIRYEPREAVDLFGAPAVGRGVVTDGIWPGPDGGWMSDVRCAHGVSLWVECDDCEEEMDANSASTR